MFFQYQLGDQSSVECSSNQKIPREYYANANGLKVLNMSPPKQKPE